MPGRSLRRSTAIACATAAAGILWILIDHAVFYRGPTVYGDTTMGPILEWVDVTGVDGVLRDGGTKHVFAFRLDTEVDPPLIVSRDDFEQVAKEDLDAYTELERRTVPGRLEVRYTYGGFWHPTWWGRQYAFKHIDHTPEVEAIIIPWVIDRAKARSSFAPDSPDYANSRFISDLESGIWEWRKPIPFGYVMTTINVAAAIAALASIAFLLIRCVRPRVD